MTPAPGSGTRSRLLAAALDLAADRGAAAITLEAVAEAAGVSKGGLLYHFPSKEALVAGMVDALCQRFAATVAEWKERAPGPGASARAYLSANAFPAESEVHQWETLASAFLLSPAQLQQWRDECRSWRSEDVEDGSDPLAALILRLAADGLWLSDMFELYPMTTEERRALVVRLSQLVQPEEVAQR
jgi:AcrR family transcriptional regulator